MHEAQALQRRKNALTKQSYRIRWNLRCRSLRSRNLRSRSLRSRNLRSRSLRSYTQGAGA
eukprot:366029-Chlamydomonas_euryale.AAC.52